MNKDYLPEFVLRVNLFSVLNVLSQKHLDSAFFQILQTNKAHYTLIVTYTEKALLYYIPVHNGLYEI